MTFDAIATAVISNGITREVPFGTTSAPAPPAELDDLDRIRSRLEAGWTISDIARRVAMTDDAVMAALDRHGFTVTSSGGGVRDVETERAELVEQFRMGAEHAQGARSSLARAVTMQSTAIARLANSGLTVPAIADRLDLDDAAVEHWLDERPDAHDG
jgi:hypothetical protein